MANITAKLPTALEAMDYVPAPGQPTMLMLGVLKKGGATGRYVNELHPMSAGGRVVCDCTFEPSDIEIYTLDGARGRTRRHLCEAGMAHLRNFVQRQEQKKLDGLA